MVAFECRPIRGEMVPQGQACPRPVIHAVNQDLTPPMVLPLFFHHLKTLNHSDLWICGSYMKLNLTMGLVSRETGYKCTDVCISFNHFLEKNVFAF